MTFCLDAFGNTSLRKQHEISLLEGIGDLACSLLHGHVTHALARELQQRACGEILRGIDMKVLAEVSARILAKLWKARDLQLLMRRECASRVRLITELGADALIDA